MAIGGGGGHHGEALSAFVVAARDGRDAVYQNTGVGRYAIAAHQEETRPVVGSGVDTRNLGRLTLHQPEGRGLHVDFGGGLEDEMISPFIGERVEGEVHLDEAGVERVRLGGRNVGRAAHRAHLQPRGKLVVGVESAAGHQDEVAAAIRIDETRLHRHLAREAVSLQAVQRDAVAPRDVEIDVIHVGGRAYGHGRGEVKVPVVGVELRVEVAAEIDVAAVGIEGRNHAAGEVLVALRRRQRLGVNQILTGRNTVNPIAAIRIGHRAHRRARWRHGDHGGISQPRALHRHAARDAAEVGEKGPRRVEAGDAGDVIRCERARLGDAASSRGRHRAGRHAVLQPQGMAKLMHQGAKEAFAVGWARTRRALDVREIARQRHHRTQNRNKRLGRIYAAIVEKLRPPIGQGAGRQIVENHFNGWRSCGGGVGRPDAAKGQAQVRSIDIVPDLRSKPDLAMERRKRVAGQQLRRRIGDKELDRAVGQSSQIEFAHHRNKVAVTRVVGDERVVPGSQRGDRQQRAGQLRSHC